MQNTSAEAVKQNTIEIKRQIETQYQIQTKSQKYPRNIRLDIIRLIAITAVVWIHCQESFEFSLVYGILSVGQLTYLFGRLGVPLFFMVSGALLMPRNVEAVDFYKRKVLHLAFISVIWLFLYRLNSDVSIMDNLVLSLKFHPSAKHTWYLAYVVLVYMLIPYICKLNTCSTGSIVLLIAVLLGIKEYGMFAGAYAGFSDIAVYVAFFLFGYLVDSRKLFQKVPVPVVGCVWIFLLGIFVFLMNNEWYRAVFTVRGLDVWWYSSPLIILIAMVSFVLIMKWKVSTRFNRLTKISKVLDVISKNSFGIYILHIVVIDRVMPVVANLVPQVGMLRTLVLYVVTMGISTCMVMLVRMCKWGRWLLWK